MKPLRIGFAGTAKNTGKTTALSALMSRLLGDGRTLAVTSIGYDGEDVDNVTGLPKPRVYAPQGVIVATSTRCAQASTAGLRQIRETSVMTPLGPVVVSKVEEAGLVILAGPSYSEGLEAVLELAEDEKVEASFIDGAFGRMAPMNVVDELLLCTGAARNRNLRVIAQEARSVEKLLELTEWSGHPDLVLPFGSLMGDHPDEEFASASIPACGTVLVKGAVTPMALERFLNTHLTSLAGGAMVFEDPVKLIVGGMPDRTEHLLSEFARKGVRFHVLKSIELLGVTVNPFYPERGRIEGTFEARYVDASELVRVFRETLHTPVVDVKREGIEVVYARVRARLPDGKPPTLGQFRKVCAL